MPSHLPSRNCLGTSSDPIPVGKPLLSRLGVRDPAARGLALSGTAHGGAVLCLSDEREAFPFAALMMSLGAACSVGLLTVAPVRALVLRVALGQQDTWRVGA